MEIPFLKQYVNKLGVDHVAALCESQNLQSDGVYSERVRSILKRITDAKEVLLTPSCTAALEMCALLLDLGPNDEVIVPAYTFVSTASAFALRGCNIVYAEVSESDLNIDLDDVAAKITTRTKVIIAVHYAGASCDMFRLKGLCEKHNICLIEDAAQAVGSRFDGRPLGSFGDLATFSFHHTKNVSAGEGGALIINNEEYVNSAHVVREKGTDRAAFLRGTVDKYTWRKLGSSYVPSELSSAFLLGQLEELDNINKARQVIWSRYMQNLQLAQQRGLLTLPAYKPEVENNGHIFYVLVQDVWRDVIIGKLKQKGVSATTHYEPLHRSPFNKNQSKVVAQLPITDKVASRIIRLPSWVGMKSYQIDYVTTELEAILDDFE